MLTMLHALGMLVADLFKSRTRLEAENLFLRHQLNIALRRAPPRLRLRGSDRVLLILMTMLWPRLLGVAQLVQPETILRWHRAGFKAFWRWKSRNRVGRPKIDHGLRDLIQRMNSENPLWGASGIHGELLMLGFEVAQSTVSKYMARPPKPPSQSWKTFLRNHAQAIAVIDMCVVPTLTFDLLFAFLVLGHGRRQLLWFEVTRHPTAEWLARQITEAFPWTSAPAYLVRDNDGAYGHVFTSRVQGDGYPRPPDLAWIAVAKWLCGTPDRQRALKTRENASGRYQHRQHRDRLGGNNADQPTAIEAVGQTGLVRLDGEHGEHAIDCHEPERRSSDPKHDCNPCPFRKSYPDVLMMQSGQDRNSDNDTGPLDCSMQGRIFL